MAALARVYRLVAILFLNTCLLLLVANTVMWLLGYPRDRALDRMADGVFDKYGEDLVAQAYPQRNLREIRALHGETWGRKLVYDGFVGFKEAPRDGNYVNVDRNGFRRVAEQGVWPPVPDHLNVFVFGGSTVFGYGIADEETIPSRLQSALRRRFSSNSISVYNFGRGYYYSSQERVLFEKLLVGGFKPDLAVFIDGLNETITERDEPTRPPIGIDGVATGSEGLNRVPMARLINRWLGSGAAKRLTRRTQPDSVLSGDPDRAICLRYLKNRELLRSAAEQAEVRVLFAWQPIPYYHPNPSANPFTSYQPDNRVAQIYEWMAGELSEDLAGSDTFWAADLQAGRKEILYVDEVHYSEVFCRVIAEAIAERLAANGP
jgi:hypothetical protein